MTNPTVTGTAPAVAPPRTADQLRAPIAGRASDMGCKADMEPIERNGIAYLACPECGQSFIVGRAEVAS